MRSLPHIYADLLNTVQLCEPRKAARVIAKSK